MAEDCYGSPAGSCAQCCDGDPNALGLTTEKGVWAFDNNTGIIYWHDGASWVAMGSVDFICASLSLCSVSSMGDVDGAPGIGMILVWDGDNYIPTNPTPPFSCSDLSTCDVEALQNVGGIAAVGNLLQYNGAAWMPVDSSSIAFDCSSLGGCSVHDLGDVDDTPAAGEVLVWDGAKYVNEARFTCGDLGACSINSLSDVGAAGVQIGEVLVWDGLEWVRGDVCTLFDSCGIEALGNVAAAPSPSLGQSLVWNGSAYAPADVAPTFSCSDLNSCSIIELSDVSGTPALGQVLQWNGSHYVPSDTAALFSCSALASCNVESMADVVGGAAEGQLMVYTSGVWTPAAPSSLFQCGWLNACSITSLSDVDGIPAAGQVLTWNGSHYVPQDAAETFACAALNACSITSLADVQGTPTEGQALVWSVGDGAYIPGDPGDMQPFVCDLTDPTSWNSAYTDPGSSFVDPDSPTDEELRTAIGEFIAVNLGLPAYLTDNNLIEVGYWDGVLFAASWPECPKRIEVSIVDNGGTREVSFEGITPSVPGYTPPADPIYTTSNWPLKVADWQAVYQSLILPQEAQVCGDMLFDGPYNWDFVGTVEGFGFVPVARPTPDLPSASLVMDISGMPDVDVTWTSTRANGDPYAADDTHTFTWLLQDAWRSYNGATGEETGRTVAGPTIEMAKISVTNGVAAWDWSNSYITNPTDQAGIEAQVVFSAVGFNADKRAIDDYLKGRVRNTATEIEGTTNPQTAGRHTEGWDSHGSGTPWLKNAGFGTSTLNWTAADANSYSEELDRGAEWVFDEVKIVEGPSGIAPDAESLPIETNPTVPTSFKRVKVDQIQLPLWTTLTNNNDTASAPLSRRLSASHMNGFDRLLSHGDGTTAGAVGGNTWYGTGNPGSKFDVHDPVQGIVPYTGATITNTGVSAGAHETHFEKINNLGMYSRSSKVITVPATQPGFLEKGAIDHLNTHVANLFNSIRTDQYFDGNGLNLHLLESRDQEVRRVADSSLVREILNITTGAGASDDLEPINLYWYFPNMQIGEVLRYKCLQTVDDGSGDVVMESHVDLMLAETY